MSDEILTAAQRRELAAFAGVTDGGELDDAALLGAAAERIGLEGEMAIDPDGVLELERGDILVVLEAVPDEDAELVDRPDLLHLGVYLRTEGEADRAALQRVGLLDPDPQAGGEAEEGWSAAWWGSACTTLSRDAPLSAQMEALHRVMNSAEAVLERQDVDPFFEELDALLLDEEEAD